LKLLVVDDGDAGSAAAIENLSRAGLPAEGKAMLVRVAPSAIGSEAAARVRSKLPGWQFFSEELKGPPEEAILRTCLWWSPDLLILGSGAFDIVHQARCSVRIAPPSLTSPVGPVRLLIGSDGSKQAAGLISAVARRSWPENTEALILSVLEKPSNDLKLQLASTSEIFANQLSLAGLTTQVRILEGDPARELNREAERWNADTIFLAASGASKKNRFLLGGVSTAVVTRAQRPVEIVRT
jgi:nucleotide-binding universal stress UspA family protein